MPAAAPRPAPAAASEARQMARQKMAVQEQAFDAAAQPEPQPEAVTAATAEVQSGATSASFQIQAPVTLPSDNSTQRVAITTVKLPATLQYQSTPSLREAAFLTAHASNGTEMPFLAGTLNTFLDDAFVASSRLKAVMPGEKLELAMGADEGISVKRQLVNRYTESTGFSGGGKRVTYEYKITVKNNKSTKEQVSFRTACRSRATRRSRSSCCRRPSATSSARTTANWSGTGTWSPASRARPCSSSRSTTPAISRCPAFDAGLRRRPQCWRRNAMKASGASGGEMPKPWASSQPSSRSSRMSRFLLHALGDHAAAQRPPHFDGGRHHGARGRLAMHVDDEVAVDLQLGEGHGGKQPHGRDAGAEIVHRQLEAAHPQQVQHRGQRKPILHGLVLGQLHFHQPRRQPRPRHQLLQLRRQVRGAQGGRRGIDGDGHLDALAAHAAQHLQHLSATRSNSTRSSPSLCAAGTKSPAAIVPSVGWSQRDSASADTMRPVVRLSCGCSTTLMPSPVPSARRSSARVGPGRPRRGLTGRDRRYRAAPSSTPAA